MLARNIRTDGPEPVVAEPRAHAKEDVDLLREVVGYYRDACSEVLCAAPEVETGALGPWIELGRDRRARGIRGGTKQRR